jgi:hypothetical protein
VVLIEGKDGGEWSGELDAKIKSSLESLFL